MVELWNKIKNLIKIPKMPEPSVPAPLILSGVPLRGGLKADVISNRVIARKTQAGLPVGNLENGDPNPDEIMIRIIVEEVIKALVEEAVIEIAIPPGSITSSGAGANAGGPVVVISTQVSIAKGYGVIH